MLNQFQKIYEQLRPFYQLIFIYDLQQFNMNDLKSLALRLQGQLHLDQREKNIHQKIIMKSKANVQKKINQKRSKMSKRSYAQKSYSKVESKSSIVKNQQKQEEYDDQACYIEQSCIIENPIEKNEFMPVRTVEGQIYDGRLMIKLPTYNKNQQNHIFYEICPQNNESFLNKQTYKQFSQNQKLSKIVLSIYNKQIEFKQTSSQSNILGLNYLRSNNILIKSNYRTQISTFSMIFTQ